MPLQDEVATESHIENPHNVTIYIPCHYDLSEAERVAPLLAQFGGKRFPAYSYTRHASYKELTELYKNHPNVTVHTFSAAEIIKQAAQETRKHIVFLLTSNVTDTFCKTQLQIFQSLRRRLADRVISVKKIEEVGEAEVAEWSKLSAKTDHMSLNVNQVVDETVKEWKTMLNSIDPTIKNEVTESRNPLGWPAETEIDNERTPPVPKHNGTPPEKVHKLRILTLNLWHGGGKSGESAEGIAAVLLKSKADIIGIQEVSKIMGGDQSDAILKALGSGWYISKQGDPLSKPQGWLESVLYGQYAGQTIYSRYPVTASDSRMGVAMKIEDINVSFFNLHLPYKPYGPYQVRGIEYEDSPPLDEKEVVKSALNTTLDYVATVKEELKDANGVNIIVGDFNEPSALDWTMDSVLAGQQIKVVKWPTSSSFEGFSDSYRAIHPNCVLNPGFTYGNEDRIDFVLVGGKNWRIDAAGLLGIDEPKWFSDHFGSWADISIWK